MLRINKPKTGYGWMGALKRPDRYLRGWMETNNLLQIDCAIGGSKFIDFKRDQIWGQLPGKLGQFTFVFDRTDVYEQVRLDPDIFFYWERSLEDGEIKAVGPPRIAYYGGSEIRAGRPLAEPHHKWTEHEIMDALINICVDIHQGMDDHIACERHNVSMWSFRELFKSRYPGEYYEWTNYRKIPQKDNLAETLVKRFPSMSCIS